MVGGVELIEGRMIVSATDLVGHLACAHVTTLDREAAGGLRPRPADDDPELEVLRERGFEHEAAYLAELEASGAAVVEIAEIAEAADGHAAGTPGGRIATLRAAQAETVAAMEKGVDVVYQATFLDERGEVLWRGHADFLRRVETSSRLGDHAYEPVDTKLARHVRPSAVLQLAHYAEQVERLQGAPPEWIHVVLGGRRQESIRLTEVAAYYRAARARFLAALDDPEGTYPVPVEHCSVCPWLPVCEERWELDDHLCRVAGLGRDQARKLERAGIPTLAALAGSPDGLGVRGITDATLARLRVQARLQLRRRPGDPPPVELVRGVEPGRGLSALPAPDPGDLFYDIEGDPFVGDSGIEYLHGVGWIGSGGELGFRAFWGHDPTGERRAFEELIDFVVERRRRFPAMHVYHYANYEPHALGKLMGRYGTREAALDDLLRGQVFVDLYRAVRQGLVVGSQSYSLKKLEPLYMPARSEAITDAASSIVEYERWLQTADGGILAEIEAYNRTDVESTRRLRDWLEGRRAELVGSGEAVRRPELREPGAPRDGGEDDSTGPDPLIELLLDGLDGAPGPGASDEERARWLMAQLLAWHRREARPEWWRYFERVLHGDETDLRHDTECIAGLEPAGEPVSDGRSRVFTYRFDPDQEHKLRAGSVVLDPATERVRHERSPDSPSPPRLDGPGRLVDLDPVAGLLRLARTHTSRAPHPRALMPGAPIPTPHQRKALREVAEALLDHGLDGPGPHAAARRLLGRRPPQVFGAIGEQALRRPGEEASDAVVRVAVELDHSYLAVQGPPGSGKTSTAARTIVELVRQGQTVGITAVSHSVISHLLGQVTETARDAGQRLRAVQKISSDDGEGCSHPDVTQTRKNQEVEDGLDEGRFDVVAGTPWLFARDGLRSAVDTLVIDEAGQLSLANVLSVAPAVSANLVLVGDPRQLAQPSKGRHPDGAGVSALDHVLAEQATIPDHLGVFLDHTWRLHPDIGAFVSEQIYDGRLHCRPACAAQAVDDGPLVGGAGLRWAPVEHHGDRTSSEDEAAAVARLLSALVGRPWTDADGLHHPLAVDDILVVAPYNAQVNLLTRMLPDGANVGTVDRFQGREAPVVIVSMASSSADDAPRGIEFLYSRNRLNVAVSRARALAVVVASPQLLSVRCRTVEQMRLANVLCRFVEMAETVAL